MNKERNTEISEYEAKGAHWCAEKLYYARQEANAYREHYRHEATARMEADAKVCMYDKLAKANENLAHILSENGVRPSRFRIYYKEHNCSECDAEWCSQYDFDTCDDYEITIIPISFYDFIINGGEIAGIADDFERIDYRCTKIVDERTGEVLYEEKEGNK